VQHWDKYHIILQLGLSF